ncbi:leucine-rich repeat-containing protein 70-like [Cylas formicarius]|uniref:leucine-rich repeat-containing protein 70-like n=1 Tax=Cylas formicarius TaxID=197179 RepID=UPI002958513C|nr:leucine-rich repeat-containing protein 70-like [Cylas formicarius]
MRRVHLVVALLVWISDAQSQQDSTNLPLCQYCYCADDVAPPKVICIKDVKEVLAQPDNWVDAQTNQSYQYADLTLANQNFIELNFTFPTANLTYLNLAKNDIYRITASAFKNLQQMKTLILSNNDLELLLPDAFKGLYLEERLLPLRSLIELRLDHNKLHTLNMDLFEHTTDLEILDLSYNPLEVIDKHTLIAIDSLIFLKELYLGNTNIKTLPDQMLHTPKYLQILDLSGNPIEKIPNTLSEAHNLTALYLNSTGFKNLTKENGFPLMNTLKILHLCRMADLERIEGESMAGLINLEELHMSDNIRLNHIDQFALAQINKVTGGTIWPPIKTLHLANNKLAYLDSDVIARWDALTGLDLRSNPWTCECENQWLIEDLMPVYLKIDKISAMQVRCAAPIEMLEYSFYELYTRHYKMRCLDMYGAEPEKDAFLLVGILGGILIAIPVILFVMLAYQRRWFGFCTIFDKSPASYSRRFYSATSSNDDYI